MPRCALLGPSETRAGAGQRVERMASSLVLVGWTVDLAVSPTTAPTATAVSAQVAQWQEERPDAVYIEVPGPWSEVWRQAALTLGLPLTVVWHATERFALPEQRAHCRFEMEILAASARTVVVESQAQQQALIQAGWAVPPRIPAGLDQHRFAPGHRSPALRQRWGARSPDTPVLLYAGRLMAEKNIGLLIEVFTACRANHPGIVAVVVGDGPEMTRLRAACPWVRCTGILVGQALAEAYASADLFLFPSRIESWGNVVTEALASSLPVVAFAAGCVPELVTDGIHGRVVADDAGFYRAVIDLVQAPKERRRMAAAAPGAVAFLTPRAMGARLAEVLIPPPLPLVAVIGTAAPFPRLTAFGMRVLAGTVDPGQEPTPGQRLDLVRRLESGWDRHRPAAVAIAALDAVGQAAAQAAEGRCLPWIAVFHPGDEPGWFRRAFATLVPGPMEEAAVTAAGGRAVRWPVIATAPSPAPTAPQGVLIIALAGPDLIHLPALVAACATFGPVDVAGDPSLAVLAPGARMVAFPADRAQAIAGATLVVLLGTLPHTSALAAEAIVAGTPVLAVQQPALADQVEEGITGFLVADTPALLRAVVGLAGHFPARSLVQSRAPLHLPDRAAAVLARVLRHAASQL